MYNPEEDFGKFALLMLVSAVVATPFVGIFGLIGVGLGLVCLAKFMKELR